MRLLLVAGAIVFGSSAYASFELAIVTDQFTGFHRFDAPTGTYLGSFGAGQSEGVKATWGDSSTGIFYALGLGGIRSWRYSTGEYLGITNFTGSSNYATNDVNGDFIHVGGGSSITRSRLSGTTTTTPIAGAALTWITRMDDGKFYMGDSANGGRILRTTGTTISSSVEVMVSSLGSANMPSTLRHAAVHVRPGFIPFVNMIVVNDTTPNDWFYGFSSTFAYAGQANYGVPGLTTRGGSARGHFGIYHVGAGTVTGTIRVVYFDDAVPTGLRSFTTSAFSNPTSMTVVLAPEPGTMIALGAGALALTRRRRKKASK